jgi:hypothetical protein
MPLARVAIICIVQAMLVFFYIHGLLTSEPPDFAAWTTFLYFWGGCLISVVICYNGDGIFKGTLAPLDFWATLAHSTDDLGDGRENRRLVCCESGKAFSPTKCEYSVRWYLFTLVNVGCQALLIGTLPLLLAQSEVPMDFVLNAAATIFVIELDDLADPKTFEIYRRAPVDGSQVEEGLPAHEATRARVDAA